MFDFEKILKLMEIEAKKRNAPIYKKIEIVDKDPFKVVVFAVLSPRTKDEILIEVCKELFKKVKNFNELNKISTKTLKRIIRRIGFYKRKARILKSLSKEIAKINRVPNNFDELINLPGIGRKVAKVILNELYNKDVIAVDTHVHRISNRLGIVKTKNVLETEKELEKIVPKNLKSIYNKIFVAFGQTVCRPIKPLCSECPLNSICDYFKNL